MMRRSGETGLGKLTFGELTFGEFGPGATDPKPPNRGVTGAEAGGSTGKSGPSGKMGNASVRNGNGIGCGIVCDRDDSLASAVRCGCGRAAGSRPETAGSTRFVPSSVDNSGCSQAPLGATGGYDAPGAP